MLTHVLSLVTVPTVVGGPAGREAIGHQKRVFAAAAAAAASLPACLSSSAATWLPNSARSRLPRLPFASASRSSPSQAEQGRGGSGDIPGEKEVAVVSNQHVVLRGNPSGEERRGKGRGGGGDGTDMAAQTPPPPRLL